MDPYSPFYFRHPVHIHNTYFYIYLNLCVYRSNKRESSSTFIAVAFYEPWKVYDGSKFKSLDDVLNILKIQTGKSVQYFLAL